jgi:hypothetical protein
LWRAGRPYLRAHPALPPRGKEFLDFRRREGVPLKQGVGKAFDLGTMAPDEGLGEPPETPLKPAEFFIRRVPGQDIIDHAPDPTLVIAQSDRILTEDLNLRFTSGHEGKDPAAHRGGLRTPAAFLIPSGLNDERVGNDAMSGLPLVNISNDADTFRREAEVMRDHEVPCLMNGHVTKLLGGEFIGGGEIVHGPPLNATRGHGYPGSFDACVLDPTTPGEPPNTGREPMDQETRRFAACLLALWALMVLEAAID